MVVAREVALLQKTMETYDKRILDWGMCGKYLKARHALGSNCRDHDTKVFRHEHTQTTWCMLRQPSLAGI